MEWLCRLSSSVSERDSPGHSGVRGALHRSRVMAVTTRCLSLVWTASWRALLRLTVRPWHVVNPRSVVPHVAKEGSDCLGHLEFDLENLTDIGTQQEHSYLFSNTAALF